MKNAIIIIALFFCTGNVVAQNRPLPTPKNLKPLTPPDLRVEEFSLVSVIRDAANKKVNIQVLVRIKNFGGFRSGASTAMAYMKSPSGAATTKTLTATLPVSDINPGASFVKVYTFREPEVSFRSGNFDFWVQADGRNTVAESDENNNLSTIITIALPAR